MKSSESLTAVRGMNKKNHIGQMWWIKYVVENGDRTADLLIHSNALPAELYPHAFQIIAKGRRYAIGIKETGILFHEKGD
ncbi:MAG: hypothetical protein ACLUIQ_05590 [Dialister invisus]